MKKTVFTLAIISALAVFCIMLAPKQASITDYAMNTVITVTARSPHADKLCQKALDEVHRIDNLMSPTAEGSDIYRINHAGKGSFTEVSPETYELIELSLKISEKTDGAFDITVNPLSELWGFTSENPSVPSKDAIKDLTQKVNYKNVLLNPDTFSVCLAQDGMSISLGAVAKGYGASQAAKILEDGGAWDGIVDLGGSICVAGNKRIGIQTPFKPRGEYFTVCEVSDTSVVTSGAYERYFKEDGKIYHHIIDPKTGYPAQTDIGSATVISDNGALADALSTAVFVLGLDKAEDVLSDFDKVSAVIYTADGRVVEVSGK